MTNKVEIGSFLAYQAFIEQQCETTTAIIKNRISAITSTDTDNNPQISDQIYNVSKYLSDCAIFTSFVFIEPLPILKQNTQGIHRTGKINTMTQNRNFQIDIERLFSAKIQIFDYTNMIFSTDHSMSSMFKVI